VQEDTFYVLEPGETYTVRARRPHQGLGEYDYVPLT